MYERRGDISNVTYKSETSMNGNVLQKHNGWHQDFSHNMSEAVGRNLWFMVYGKTSYDSTDGKTWKKADFQDPDWEQKARAERSKMLNEMTDVECTGERELDGRVVEVFSYVYKTETPYPSHSKTTVFYDRAENFVYRTISEDLSGTGMIITHTYSKEDVIIPNPDG